MGERRERILLCLAHMSGREMKFIEEAFADNWVVPLGPNVNGFEEDLKQFINNPSPSPSQPSSQESANLLAQEKVSLPSQGSANQLAREKASLPPQGEVGGGLEVVALSAGTAAVHMALLACGVGPGDEVMVQSFTFCASAHPVTYLGGVPVFVDSEPDSWNMDPQLLDQAIADRISKTGKKPKAIVPVYLYGMPARIDEILAVGAKYDIPVIEDAAEGFGSRFDGRMCGTFGKYGVLSFNGNKMITTSGGGALICPDKETRDKVMWYATQAREPYPYYQHEAIGYNYRMSNICAGIGRGQMTIVNEHIAHHRHVQAMYRELLKGVDGITLHENPSPRYDSNFWLCTATLDPELHIKGQENAYSQAVTGAVGGVGAVVRSSNSGACASTNECCDPTSVRPNDNVEALRVALDKANVESRPLWKPMHRQPVYRNNPAYVNGVSDALFKVGICLPAGPHVTDDDLRYIVDIIQAAID